MRACAAAVATSHAMFVCIYRIQKCKCFIHVLYCICKIYGRISVMSKYNFSYIVCYFMPKTYKYATDQYHSIASSVMLTCEHD